MKRVFAIVIALGLSFSMFTLTGCVSPASNSSNTKSTAAAQDENFSLNDTATFKNIKVTANEIIINPGSDYIKPADGKEFVAVKFTIENISKEDQSISSILLFDAYADNVKCEYSFSATQGLSGTLDGTVSPGKQLVGYYGVEVPKDTKKLDLGVKGSWLGSEKAQFIFDVPAK